MQTGSAAIHLVSTHRIHGRGSAGWNGFRDLGDDDIRCQERSGDRSCVLKGAPHHLGGIDDTGLEQILVLVCGGIVPYRCVLLIKHLQQNVASSEAAQKLKGNILKSKHTALDQKVIVCGRASLRGHTAWSYIPRR